jgi:hypothetical protein
MSPRPSKDELLKAVKFLEAEAAWRRRYEAEASDATVRAVIEITDGLERVAAWLRELASDGSV